MAGLYRASLGQIGTQPAAPVSLFVTLGAVHRRLIKRQGTPHRIADWTDASVINAGDGSHEHPTQALLDAYTIGGKPRLGEDPGRWDRISLWITNSARITNPVQYTVVQLQSVVDQPTLPGEAPARPVADPDEPVVSVVMMRDLGNLRLRPALVTIGSLLVFLALCHWLHVRDKEVMARREEFESAKA